MLPDMAATFRLLQSATRKNGEPLQRQERFNRHGHNARMEHKGIILHSLPPCLPPTPAPAILEPSFPYHSSPALSTLGKVFDHDQPSGIASRPIRVRKVLR